MNPIIKRSAMATILAAMSLVILLGSWMLGGGTIAGYASHSARLAVAVASVAMFLVLPFALAHIGDAARKGDHHEKQQDPMILFATLLSLALVIVSPLTDGAGFMTLPGGDALRMAGAAIYVAGGVLMLWGPMHLGKHFSVHVTLQDDHQLITDGPFAMLRHPRYAGCIYWGVALPLVFASGPGLAVAVPYVWMFFWRMRDEEKMLGNHFGPEWTDYAAHTKRIVPFVY